jgi:thymidylate synthase (FAD)
MSEVNLVGMTKPSAYTGCSTANELVAWAARVSNPSNQNNTATASKLVQYRQILRHRSFSFQEYSQRYADPTADLGFVRREARLQDAKNRQNSIEVEDAKLAEEWNMKQAQLTDQAFAAYTWAVSRGIAKEQARAVLPEGLTESVMIVTGTLRSWVHYCELRMDKATQKEHRIVAEQCWEIIAHHFPDVKLALDSMAAQAEFERKLP